MVPERVGDGVEVLALPDRDAFAPGRLRAALAARGLGRVLVEGGGVTVSRFLRAGRWTGCTSPSHRSCSATASPGCASPVLR
ncbi:hypothetical protein O1L44_31785 [Streptomyces noursei]|nr:hypothetical protein [Streptomyces noursei]